MSSDIDNESIKNFAKMVLVHRLFLNNPDYIVKKILKRSIGCISSFLSDFDPSTINMDNNSLITMHTHVNKMTDIITCYDMNEQDEYMKYIKEILFQAKLYNINIILDPYDLDYELSYINSTLYKDDNNLNITDLYLNLDDLEQDEVKLNELYCFRSYGGYIEMYSHVNNDNQLVLCFRQTNSLSDWKYNLQVTQGPFQEIINKANEKEIIFGDCEKYKNIFIHRGFLSGFLLL